MFKSLTGKQKGKADKQQSRKTNKTNTKMAELSLNKLPIIVLSVNVLNIPVKGQRLVNFKKICL